MRYLYSGVGGFQVEYDGPGKRLSILVAGENAPPVQSAGSTRRQVTLRGQPATLQVDDPELWLWWNEPGHWQNAAGHGDHVAYMLRAEGMTPEEVLTVARSMAPAG